MALARTGAALTLILIASTVLNAALFPEVANVVPLAREVSTFSGAIFSVFIAVAAYTRPSWIRERAISCTLLALLAAGLLVLGIGLTSGNGTLVMLGSPLGGIGMLWFSVLLGVALTQLPLREAFVVVPAAYVAAYALRFMLTLTGSSLPLPAAILLYFFAVAGSYLLIAADVRGIMTAIQRGESPTVLDATNPSSFLPFSSFVYVTILLFNAACGFEMAQTGGTLPATGELLACLPVALVLIAAIARPGGPVKLDTLYLLAALLVVAGLLLIPLRTLPPDVINLSALGPAVLLRGGADTFSLLTYFLIAAIGSRNPVGALTTSAFAFSASWLGIIVGALGQEALTSIGMASAEVTLLATAFVTFAFVLYNFVGLRNRSFDGSVAAVVPAFVPFENDSDTPTAPHVVQTSQQTTATRAPSEGERPKAQDALETGPSATIPSLTADAPP